MATVVGKAEPFKNENSTLSVEFLWDFGGHTFKEYLDYDISEYKRIVTSKQQFQNGFLASTNHYVQCYIVPSFGYKLFIKFCMEESQTLKLNSNMFPPKVKVNLSIPIFRDEPCGILTDAMKKSLITRHHFANNEFDVAKQSKVYWFYWDRLYGSLSDSKYRRDIKIFLNFEFNHCSLNENKRSMLATEVGGNDRMSGPAPAKRAKKLPAVILSPVNTQNTVGRVGVLKIIKKLPVEEYLFSERFSDFTIQCGAKSFYAHRMVIADKSPVLAAILEQPLEEAKERRFVIEDFKPEAVEELLRFIYTEKANVKDYAKELFQLSHKYEVADLRILSENALISKVEKTNLIDMNELGKMYNSKKLLDKCYATFKMSRASLLKTKSDVDKFSDFILRFATE